MPEKRLEKIEVASLYKRYINNPLIEEKRPKLEEFKNDPDYEINKNRLREIEERIEKEEKEREEAGVKKSKERELKQKAFEGLLVLEGKKIFGEETEIIPASRFDDVVNNIDLVLEAPFENKIIHLGIDASVSDIKEHRHRKVELIDRTRIKSGRLDINYFQSVLQPEVKGKLKNIPRIAIIIPSEQLNTFFQLTHGTKEQLEYLQFYISKIIKPQLENQFIFAVSVNKARIEAQRLIKEKPGQYLRLRKKDQEVVDNFYEMAKKVSKGGWGKISDLLNFFENNQDIFKKESITIPDFFDFLSQIKSLLNWLYQKEKAASLELEAAALGTIPGHWDSEAFGL